MNVYKVIETKKVIIFNIYYEKYGKTDRQITYIKILNGAIRKVISEIYYIKTIFY